jgi:hypothetical protein
MNETGDMESLLNDVLTESDAADLRETMLKRTLGHVKRRRVFRQIRRAGSALGVVAAFGLLIWLLSLPIARGPHIRNPLTLWCARNDCLNLPR